MQIDVFERGQRVPVTVVHPHGSIDASNYTELIERGRHLAAEGTREIVLDLADVPFISSAGLMAVHILALLLRGEKLPESESGRAALKAIPTGRSPAMQEHMRLCGLQPGVAETFEKAGFTRLFAIHPDLQAAVDAN